MQLPIPFVLHAINVILPCLRSVRKGTVTVLTMIPFPHSSKKTKNSNETASIYSHYLQWRPCSLVAAPAKSFVATFLKGASAKRDRDTREAILSRSPSRVICPGFVLAPQNLPEFIVAPQRPNKRCSYCFQTKKVKEGKIRTVKPY